MIGFWQNGAEKTNKQKTLSGVSYDSLHSVSLIPPKHGVVHFQFVFICLRKQNVALKLVQFPNVGSD